MAREQDMQRIAVDPDLLDLARRAASRPHGHSLDPAAGWVTAATRSAGLYHAGGGRTAAAEGRRQQLIAAVRAAPHTLIKDHLEALGFSRSQYQQWRNNFPQWRAELDGVRLEVGGGRAYTGGFAQFRWEFFGRQTYPHQQLIVDAIEEAPPLTVTLILVPPEAGKTTLMEEYVAAKTCENAAFRTQYWAKNPEEARKRVMRVKAMLTEPGATRAADGTFGKIIGRFGPFYDRGQEGLRPWRADRFTVAKAPLRERDGTMEAKGIKTVVQGTRAELIVFDDVQDLSNLNDSLAILRKIRQEASTRLSESTGGKCIWLGTRVEVNDVFDAMFQLPESEWFLHRVIEIPALDAEGRSYCPQMHSVDSLMRRKQLVGSAAWARCYMMNPLSAGRMTFPRESITHAKDAKLGWGMAVPGMPAILSIDPALSPGVCAFLVASVEDPEHLRLVEATKYENFASLAHITAELERYCIAYPGLSDLIVEDNFFRGALTQDPEFRRIVKQYDLTLHEHITGRNKQHHDMGISALGRAFTRGTVRIPDLDDGQTREMFRWGCEQLEKWKPGVPDKLIKQDFVIVLWMAWLRLDAIRQALEADQKRNLEQFRRHQAHQWGTPVRRTA
jgi:hypothetical protein